MLSKIAVFVLVVTPLCFAMPMSAASREHAAQNDRPVIGILTQPYDTTSTSDYIAASYVKFIESAGGRVVPIFTNATESELDATLVGLNGVLFPGGGADLGATSPFFKGAKYVWDTVMKANDNGEHMPLWATCLGFELVNIIVSEDHDLLSHMDSENYTVPLTTTDLFASSRIFQNAPSDVVDTLTQEAVTMNNHMFGVIPDKFNANPKLVDFFDVLSTNKDRAGLEFLSTIEGKSYPVYSTQWHPEKNQFEWNLLECIDHSRAAIKAMQYVADFIVDEARLNDRAYATESELHNRLIYNYNPEYSGNDTAGKSFEQIYHFYR